MLEKKHILVPSGFETEATFSADHVFRYSLYRRWNRNLPLALFVLHNPSVADEIYEDPTQIRVRNYCIRWGFGGYYVANLFSMVSTPPEPVWDGFPRSIGRDNDSYLESLQGDTQKTFVAWGSCNPVVHRRAIKVAHILRKTRELYAISLTKDGCPHHPLYQRADLQPVEWRKWA